MPLDGNELDIKQVAADLKASSDAVKRIAEDSAKEIKAAGALSEESKAAADKALTEMNTLAERIKSVELRLSRPSGGGDRQETKSAGEQVTDSESFKSFVANGARGTIRIETKAITSATGSAGVLIEPQRLPGIDMLHRPRLTVRQLLAPGTTTTNALEYVQQKTRTNAAAVVAETAQKPESSLDFEVKTAPVRTIAHWIPVSRQAMDDIPQLQSIIDGEMRWMLDAAEETELLTGDGTGQHLLGLIPQATAFVAAFTPAMASRVDYIRLGMLQVALEDFSADAVVLHPNDWAQVELAKEATSGAYLFSNPTSGVLGPRLWGLPVVDTRAVDEGDFLVGAFRIAGQIFDRMGTEVLISSEDRDNFIKNMLTVRAEKRLGLVVRRPQALVYGTFPAAEAP